MATITKTAEVSAAPDEVWGKLTDTESFPDWQTTHVSYPEGPPELSEGSTFKEKVTIMGMPGEPFVEFGLNFRDRAPAAASYFAGYCNGYQGYFPTIRAASQGGYGAEGITARVEVGAGEITHWTPPHGSSRQRAQRPLRASSRQPRRTGRQSAVSPADATDLSHSASLHLDSSTPKARTLTTLSPACGLRAAWGA